MNLNVLNGRSNPELSSVAADVPAGEDVKPLIGAMFALMYAGKGIGLAANQVGVLKRVIVVHVAGMKQALINPVISKRSARNTTSVEGCLSFPGKTVPMERSKAITVQGFDEDWTPIKFKASGLFAYCIQHEVDHLNGITII